MVDSPEHGEHQEHADEAQHAEHDVRELHGPCVRHPLADFDGESDYDNQRKNVYPTDDHDVVVPGQPFEHRVHHEYHGHPQRADDQEMQFLVGKIVFVGIVEPQQIAVYPRDDLHDSV